MAARAAWRDALALLPPESRQARAILDRVAALNERIAATPGTAATDGAPHPSWVKRAGPLGVLAFFLLTKGKLLLLGLTKVGTLASMILAMGVYWTAWGWRFALGLVVSIYIHEMGHVAALRRYGIPATAPMFIPGFGAVVRMKQYPASVVEDARVGLAGPVWGAGAALAAYGVFLATAAPPWAAIARAGAWINLFNLLPVRPLDGGRGFSALSTGQRWLVTFTLAGAWAVTHEGLLILLLIAAALRTIGSRGADRPDGRALVEFVALVAGLAALAAIKIAAS